MRSIHSVCAAFALLVAVPQLSFAEAPATPELQDQAVKLLRSMNMEKTYNQMLSTITGQYAKLSDPKKQKLTQFLAKILDYKALEPKMASIYARNYTQAELSDLADFYNSPTGRKSLEIMPKVMMESMRLTQSIMQENRKELAAIANAKDAP